MGMAAVVLWTAPVAIIAVYLDIADPANRETFETARRLLAIAALFQVFDGMQVIAAYCAATGTRWSRCCSRHSDIGASVSPAAGSLPFRSATAPSACGGG